VLELQRPEVIYHAQRWDLFFNPGRIRVEPKEEEEGDAEEQ
jgi:hypothetical protein